MTKLEKILNERPKVHGDFAVGAKFTQGAMRLLEDTPNWEDMPDDQREALHMILHKIQRIAAGDNSHADHWDDLAGYATIISRSLK